VCKKLIKNSQPFRKKISETCEGGIFLTHTVDTIGTRVVYVGLKNYGPSSVICGCDLLAECLIGNL